MADSKRATVPTVALWPLAHSERMETFLISHASSWSFLTFAFSKLLNSC